MAHFAVVIKRLSPDSWREFATTTRIKKFRNKPTWFPNLISPLNYPIDERQTVPSNEKEENLGPGGDFSSILCVQILCDDRNGFRALSRIPKILCPMSTFVNSWKRRIRREPRRNNSTTAWETILQLSSDYDIALIYHQRYPEEHREL